MGNDNYGLVAIGVLAIVLLFVGARAVDNGTGQVRIGQGEAIDAPAVRRSGGAVELLIRPSRGGSFFTEASFDGAAIEVLIDTGASATTLREDDAFRAGINPKPKDYVHRFSTANGDVMAAKAQVDELEIGDAVLSDITVYVIPDDLLNISLLGMNTLRKFDRMEMTRDGLSLILE